MRGRQTDSDGSSVPLFKVPHSRDFHEMYVFIPDSPAEPKMVCFPTEKKKRNSNFEPPEEKQLLEPMPWTFHMFVRQGRTIKRP